jgi:hypothetical protein
MKASGPCLSDRFGRPSAKNSPKRQGKGVPFPRLFRCQERRLSEDFRVREADIAQRLRVFRRRSRWTSGQALGKAHDRAPAGVGLRITFRDIWSSFDDDDEDGRGAIESSSDG